MRMFRVLLSARRPHDLGVQTCCSFDSTLPASQRLWVCFTMSEDWGKSIIDRMQKDANPLNWRLFSSGDNMKLEDNQSSSSYSRRSRFSSQQSSTHSDQRGHTGSPSGRDQQQGRPEADLGGTSQENNSFNRHERSQSGQRIAPGSSQGRDTQTSRLAPRQAEGGDTNQSRSSRSFFSSSSTQYGHGDSAGSPGTSRAQQSRPEPLETDLEASLLEGSDRDVDQKRTIGRPPGPDANSSARQSSLLQSSSNLANTVVGAGDPRLRTRRLMLRSTT